MHHFKTIHRVLMGAIVVFVLTLGQPSHAQQENPTPAQQAFRTAYQNAINLWDQGDHRQSVAMYERALVLCDKAYGKNSNYSSIVAYNVGNGWAHLKDYAKAEPYFRRSIAISESKMDKKELGVNPSFEQLMLMLAQQGQLSRVEELLNHAIQSRTTKLGRTHPSVSGLWFYLAHARLVTGDYKAAEKASKTSIALRVEVNGPKHGIVSTSLRQLANIYIASGRFELAQDPLIQSMEGFAATWGPNHYVVGLAKNDLARIYQRLGRFNDAKKLFVESMRILRLSPPDQQHELLSPANNLGLVHLDQKEWEKAAAYFEQAIEFAEQLLDENDPKVALILANLTIAYTNLGDLKEARELGERSLQIRMKQLGSESEYVAHSLVHLARIDLDAKEFAQAEKKLRQAAAIAEKKLGANAPLATLVLEMFANVYMRQGQWDKGLQVLNEMQRRTNRYVDEFLMFLSESDQLTYLKARYRERIEESLGLAFVRLKDRNFVESSTEWLLNSKAVTLPVLARRAQASALNSQTNPKLKQAIASLQLVRAKMASITKGGLNPLMSAEELKQLEQLRVESGRLSRLIGQQLATKPSTSKWTKLDEVRKAMPTGSVLVEYVRVNSSSFTDSKPHYLAWIIPASAKEKLSIVDLGLASDIEKNIQAFRQSLDAEGRFMGSSEERASAQRLDVHLQTLADQILKPLMPAIRRHKRLIISPDAELWTVPWSALPVATNKYAIEQFAIQYVVSGRSLVAKTPKGNLTDPVVLYEPDYNHGVQPGRSLNAFSPLPGTKVEGESIRPLIARYTKASVETLTRSAANEAAIKALKKPRIAVFSTHGFYDGERITKAKIANPLLRCGLALAGANTLDQASGFSGNDGVLTGLEIAGLDLRGTELVVLSACQTGLGQVQVGEGVQGMRQAFQLAGAQSVVATLWSIPDMETAVLMKEFFTQLVAGKKHADALRFAQLKVILQRRAQTRAAHPIYWAAFTLTGH